MNTAIKQTQDLNGKNGLSGWNYFLPSWTSTTTAENERYSYITQENVYTTFTIYAEKGKLQTTYVGTKQVLSTYFSPRKNVQMAVYKFRNCKQSGTQTLDEYVTELRKLSKDLEFHATNKEILSQVIQHCKSN